MKEADALVRAAEARRAAGDARSALALAEQALALAQGHRKGLLLRASLLLDTAPLAAAETVRRVVAVAPRDVEALGLLGQALSAAGRAGDAVAAFAAAAEALPHDGAVLSNLGIGLLRAGDAVAALEAARRAVAVAPGLSEAHAACGHALGMLGRHDEAIAAFLRAFEINPRSADALMGLARIYRALGRPSTAAMALQRAVDLAPAWTGPLVELATAYRDLGDFALAMETSRLVSELSPGIPHYDSNLMLDYQYRPDAEQDVATEEARRWGVRLAAALPEVDRAPARTPRADGRIRIGYVSADLYRHPVGWLAGGVIAAHERSSFHVTIYAGQQQEDALTRRIRAAVDTWVPVQGLDDEALARRIADDGIEVLFDLSGHTAGNRLAAFARRPAPVQISWLGYFATTGLPTMDYVIADSAHLADGAAADFTERILLLPRIRYGYTPPDDAPDVVAPPSARSGRVTFGCFNNASKLNPDLLRLWGRLLLEVPGSRLLLKWRSLDDPFLQDKLATQMTALGVERERIVFNGATPHAAMLAQYGTVDVALDPFPFSGGLTTCEALWMGVPVVTMPGRRFVSRQTHAILDAIGATSWSAATPDAYISTAAALARDAVGLADIRRSMRGRLTASPLLDVGGLARCIEDLCRTHRRPPK